MAIDGDRHLANEECPRVDITRLGFNVKLSNSVLNIQVNRELLIYSEDVIAMANATRQQIGV